MVKPLNQQSGMPQMSAVFSGWTKKICLDQVIQSLEGGFEKETVIKKSFVGIIQPLSPKTLAMKPEGLRNWKWLQVHCQVGGLQLDNNDKVRYNGVMYRVDALLDYSLNNFLEYHLVEDFQNAGQ